MRFAKPECVQDTLQSTSHCIDSSCWTVYFYRQATIRVIVARPSSLSVYTSTQRSDQRYEQRNRTFGINLKTIFVAT